MDPEELAAALAGNNQQGQGQDDYSWDGRTATNPRTGERIIWRGNRRTGRFVAMNYENADPQSRERVETVQNRADIGARVLPQAQQFLERNLEAPTGGLQNTLQGGLRAFAAGMRPDMFSEADSLRALSRQMVGSNWVPGTSTMMNTATEQENIAQRFPSTTNLGDANLDVYLNMAGEIAVQQAAAEAMRQWLREHPNLDGFDQAWRQEEDRIRQEARRVAQQGMFDYQQRGRQRQQGGGAPQWREGGQPAESGVETWERGPDGSLRPRR